MQGKSDARTGPVAISSSPRLRVAVVLGAGGPVGHAYHAGVLRALSHALGWDPREAELLLGTSAGAQVAALLRAGMQPDDLAARAGGDPLSEAGRRIAACYTRPDHSARGARRALVPASPAYLLRALRRPWRARPGRLVSALLPAGHVSMHAQAEGLRRLFGERWPDRRLWITAVELASGEPVAFGRPGAPATDVGTAVACSGSVPGVCAPVRVGNARFVDGGIASATHLDLLDPSEHDLVLVSSPLSMFGAMRALLRTELRRLERRGARVVAFEPRGSVLDAMGSNPMRLERSRRVVRAAYRATLRDVEQPAFRAAAELLGSR